ncbi:MAG: hypothetical protein NVS3B21_23560 [Acidimicrobiales bacterium]
MEAVDPSGDGHAMSGYVSDRSKRTHVAPFTCGWESEPVGSPGLAYAQWDTHAERECTARVAAEETAPPI